MTLYLFDIDMTLIDSAGAGRQAMDEVFRELYGVENAFDGVRFHGRTDAGLVREAAARHGIADVAVAPASEAFVDVFVAHLARALLERSGRVLPGARELLEALIADPGAEVGLATGNFRRGAEVKLGHFGLLDLVRQGGFGDDHTDRSDVIRTAGAKFGQRADPGAADRSSVVVIGDTALEMAAAHAAGFRAVGVATGFDSIDDLEAAEADLVLEDLADTAAVVAALRHMTRDQETVTMADSDGAASGVHDLGPTATPEPAELDESVPAPDPPLVRDDDGPAAGDDHEVEAKFAMLDPSAAEGFLARSDLAGSHTLGPVATTHLVDTYVDTWDRSLLRKGVSLRVRRGGGLTKVTVKGLQNLGSGAVQRRLEHETSFGPGPADALGDVLDPARWHEEMRSVIANVTGPEPEFLPVCAVGHVRHIRDVFGPVDAHAAGSGGAGPSPMAELCVEDVTVYRPPPTGDRPEPSDAVGEFAELEVELAPGGSLAELSAIATWLAEQPSLLPIGESKLQRSLRLVASHPPGYEPGASGVQPDMPMAEAGRLVWRQQLIEILLHEAGARQGDDIEFVHDMRVATRRARASGALFAEWFVPKKIEPFQDGLRKTGRRLGAVRDLDVALYKLAKFAAGCPADDRDGLKELRNHWRRARRRAYVDLLDWIDSASYRRFISRFEAFCSSPGKGVRSAGDKGVVTPTQVRHVMPMAIFDRYVAVRAYEVILDGDGAVSVPDATLHALRIECKYLRYALEMVRHLLGDDGEALIKQLRTLQDHLGDLNDAVVARKTLVKMQRKGVGGAAVQRYIDVQDDAAAKLRADFPPVWRAFVEVDNRAQLYRALARL